MPRISVAGPEASASFGAIPESVDAVATGAEVFATGAVAFGIEAGAATGLEIDIGMEFSLDEIEIKFV